MIQVILKATKTKLNNGRKKEYQFKISNDNWC